MKRPNILDFRDAPMEARAKYMHSLEKYVDHLEAERDRLLYENLRLKEELGINKNGIAVYSEMDKVDLSDKEW